MNDGAYHLVLLRHGESDWNAAGLFTGWADPGLTPEGERQAVHAGHTLARQRLFPDAVHPSPPVMRGEGSRLRRGSPAG